LDLPIPAWFKYRQCEAKSVDAHCVQVTAPQMEPVFMKIRRTETGWQAALAKSADGPDTYVSAPNLPNEREAWAAAFELLRVGEIV
jgi:hypothetical protein